MSITTICAKCKKTLHVEEAPHENNQTIHSVCEACRPSKKPYTLDYDDSVDKWLVVSNRGDIDGTFEDHADAEASAFKLNEGGIK